MADARGGGHPAWLTTEEKRSISMDIQICIRTLHGTEKRRCRWFPDLSKIPETFPFIGRFHIDRRKDCSVHSCLKNQD